MICTGGHPFYVKEFDKFIRAEELKIGFTLLLSDGTPVRIEAIEKECLSVPETTYNFEVADFHTYYVAESKILTHNTCKQIHHYLTNKNQRYTPKIEEILKDYGLDLDGSWNKELLPHSGRHANDYHEYMIERIKEIAKNAEKDKTIFLKEFEKIKSIVRDNPQMMYKAFWKSGGFKG